MIIGFLGEKRSGKDTCGNYIIENYGFERYAFADPIKKACQHLFGFTDEQCWGELKDVIDMEWDITPREAFQILGTEIFQYDMAKYLPALAKVGRGWWSKRFKMWYQDKEVLDQEELKVILTDVRFQHEVDPIHKLGGFVFKVVRPDQQSNDGHASEAEMAEINNFDAVIYNDGTLEDLYEKLDVIMKQIMNGEIVKTVY